MPGLQRKILPAVPSIPEGDDDSLDYSFAIEYQGPPVPYDIPQVVPIDVGKIPTAAAAAALACMSNDLSLPVIQPIVKSKPLKKTLIESKLGLEPPLSLNLEAPVELRVIDGHDCRLICSNSHSMSCKLLKVIDNSAGSSNVDNCTPTVSEGIANSAMLGFSSSHDNLNGSLERLGKLNLPEVCKESPSVQQYSNFANLDSTESALSSQALSSDISSCTGDDFNNESPCNITASVEIYHDSASSRILHDKSCSFEMKIIQERQVPEKVVRKGLCYRCFKGSKLTRKEACIVCDAKYCRKCIRRAMGSMPEGRKCLSCIGYPINESKRMNLGKCSHLLKLLLTELEVKQIMKSEILCEANQLPSELVCVNGKPLCQKEMFILQNCPIPPKNLEPGKFWYDKVSGLWGKEGQKPCQIISAELNVGAPIRQDASNGNTNVLINHREITKAELFMLKSAGVQCEGNPHFWVSADGTCQEEGQNQVRGKIWGKTRTKIVCSILSLPTLSKSRNHHQGEAKVVVDEGVPNYHEQRLPHKLLLVGYNKSGTSTIYKQAKILYNVPFSEDERKNIKFTILSNLYGYLGILLEGRKQFEEELLIAMRARQSTSQSGPSG